MHFIPLVLFIQLFFITHGFFPIGKDGQCKSNIKILINVYITHIYCLTFMDNIL